MGYKRRLLSILLISMLHAAYSQTIPFRFPLDTIPLLSGTFGEFRGSHFHAGIDIKTYGKIGLPVYATADGYVSRIKISPFGYGKAIYLTHDNGYTSVYGHLSGFNTELETYIRKHQYEKKSFSIELFPGKSHFKVKQGDIIAFSGNSGGSYAPHLHFELRDSRTQEILDPLGFSLPVLDTMPPLLCAIKLVQKDRHSKLQNGYYPSQVSYLKNNDSLIEMEAPAGEYALTLAARDFLIDDTNNVLGVYSVNIALGEEQLYHRTSSRFSFRDSRYIHLISSFEEGLPPLEHCYKEPWITHGMANYKDDGWFSLNTLSANRVIIIRLSDAFGHSKTYHLTIKLNNQRPITQQTQTHFGCQKRDVYNEPLTFTFTEKKHIVDFFKGSFFDTLSVHVCLEEGLSDTLRIFPENGYVSERFRIVYELPKILPAQERQLCLARMNNNQREYIGGEANNGQIQCFSRDLGTYYLSMDTLAPTVDFQSVNSDSLFITIDDDFSGIAKYTAKINGRWFLMEYDPKKKLLYGDLSEFQRGSKLELVLFVKDNRDNSTTFKQTIQIQ